MSRSGRGLVLRLPVADAEPVGQNAQWHTECMRYSVPGVERAARLAGFEVDEDGPGETGQLGQLVVGELLLGAEAGEFVPQRLMVGVGRLAVHALNTGGQQSLTAVQVR